MQNFTFQNPTEIIFGEGQISEIDSHIPQDANVLLIYGGGSIKKNGTYDQVIKALGSRTVTEFSGIEANPSYETCMKAVRLLKEKNSTYLLAVGGGSVIDATKFITAAACYEGDDPWDLLKNQEPFVRALPFASVLTLSATGSEMNNGSVITRKSTKSKLFFGSPLTFPKFSVMDPTVTFSLPPRQVANGVVDAFVHVMEQYLTYDSNAPLQDRFAESILQTLIEVGPVTLKEPTNYDARASMMWCATQALNGLLRAGVAEDWATHMIGHELTALHGLDHAQTLAIILPTVMSYKRDKKHDRLVQYAERVWHIDEKDEARKVTMAIDKTRAFFESLGVKTRLSEYNINESHIPDLVDSLEKNGRLALGEHGDIALADSRKILELSL